MVILPDRALWILIYVDTGHYGQRSFKYSGAKEWNMLPLDIKVLTKCEGFRIRVKRLFLGCYVVMCEDCETVFR